jgi:hypothetical protein
VSCSSFGSTHVLLLLLVEQRSNSDETSSLLFGAFFLLVVVLASAVTTTFSRVKKLYMVAGGRDDICLGVAFRAALPQRWTYY